MRVAIALPAYNEATVLTEVLRSSKRIGEVTIIIIDDGSTDDTPTIALNEDVRTIRHVCNRGAGAASQTAIEWARMYDYDIIVFMDADGQHEISDVRKLVNEVREGTADIIIGNRFHNDQNSVPGKRILYNRMANVLTNFFCHSSYQDTQSGLRALNKKAIQSLDLKVDGFGFCSEMIIVAENLGLKVKEVPINVKYTTYSMSKGQSFSKGIDTAFQFIWRILFG